MTDGSAMVVLSLVEAAEKTATSKVDIWRAIQEGALPAQKTSDGTYAINPCDLFRVFERKKPDSRLTLSKQAPVTECADVARTDEAPEPAATREIVAAFEALQAELRSLLRSPDKGAPSGEGKRPGECEERLGEERPGDFDESSARVAVEHDDGKTKAEFILPDSRRAAADPIAGSAGSRRLWWRRLVG